MAERIHIVEDIWDSISNSPESLTISKAEKVELDKRLGNYKKDKTKGIEWETMKKNLLKPE